MISQEENFPHKWMALIGLSLLSFTAFLDYTIVTTALPFIQDDLNANVLQLQWITNIFAMTISMFMVISGKAGDLFGRKRLFFAGFLIFGIAAVGAALSATIHELIFFRGIQGFAAAIVATLGVALLPQAFPEKEQTHAISIFSAFNGAGLALGPFIGGILITWWGWRAVFWFNIPIIVIGFALSLFTLKPSPSYTEKIQLDWKGLILLMLGLGGLVYGIIHGEQAGWNLLSTWIYLLVGTISLIVLYPIENRQADPLLDFTIFKSHPAVVSILLCASAGFVAYVFMFFDPLYLELMRQQTAFYIGLTLLTVPLIQIFISVYLKNLLKQFHVINLLIFGILMALISGIFHLFFTPTISILFVLMGLLLMGYTWGISNAGVIVAMKESMPPQKMGSVMGTIFTFWNVSGSVFLALSTVLFHWRQDIAMRGGIATQHINLSGDENEKLNLLLADPNQIHDFIQNFSGDKAAHLLDIFQSSFMHAYHTVMLFSIMTLFLLLIGSLQFRK